MLQLNVNGRVHQLDVDREMPLLWLLRDTLGLTATKFGCGAGLCGACTIHLDGEPVRSCQVLAGDVGARKVETLEHVSGPEIRALRQAWLELNVPQCGYCQAGQLMTSLALLREIPHPDSATIRTRLSGNLCRCGTYGRIESAILRASGGDAS